MGFKSSRKKSDADKDSGTVRSAVLALLGLLPGFSFAIAATRHEARRELLVEEANSIGTTARRAEAVAAVARFQHCAIASRVCTTAHRGTS
jgi:hypothetical protein